MKIIMKLTLAIAVVFALAVHAQENQSTVQTLPEAQPSTNGVPITNSSAQQNERVQSGNANGTSELPPGMLKLNFRGASLEQVLSYLSEAAGFVINIRPGTSVRGKVDVWSNEPVTKEEALDLLDTVLNQNNLAA